MTRDYRSPESVEEAISLLHDNAKTARVIAGGTALLLDGTNMTEGLDCYVSLARITELDGIADVDGHVVIGANATLAECAQDDLILKNAPSLAQAASAIASTQVRNMATVLGNVCAARPFGDAAVALASLDAVCVVRSAEGTREVPITDMYAKIGESAVDSREEVVTHIKFRTRSDGEGVAFERLDLRSGLSFPVVNVGVKVRLDDGVIVDSAVVAAPLSPGPSRVPAAEAFLAGKAPTEELLRQAGDLASESVRFHKSPERCRSTKTNAECSYDACRFCANPVHSSAQYRHEVLPVLVRRALLRAAGLAAQPAGF
jgi:carbon-monoxide dehydrogenase medium subunit